MDALVLERPISQSRSAIPSNPRPLLAWAVGLALTVGIAWRLGRYLCQFPFWGDEAFVLLNLFDHDFWSLTGPLEYAQVAPLLFLWIEKAALEAFGHSELALRLAPLMTSLSSLVLFWRFTRSNLAPATAAIALALFAVSYYPVRHGCEVKPYAFDGLAALLLLTLAARWLRSPGETRWLLALALVVPVLLFLSYPAVFTAGGIALALLPAASRGNGRTRWCYVLFGGLLVLGFLAHYGLVGRQQIATEASRATRDFMQDYWHESFPPASLLGWPGWLLNIHTGNLFAYPIGAAHGASSLSFLLALVGGVSLWQRQRSLFLLCVLPFGVTFLAAVLHKYPYGGSARVAQHLAPAIVVLMAAGLTAVLSRCRADLPRAAFVASVLLTCFGAFGLARDLQRPYKTEQDYAARRLVENLRATLAPGEVVMIVNSWHDVLANLTYYLRQDDARLRWLGRDRLDEGSVERAMLLFLDTEPRSEGYVLHLLGSEAEGWTPLASIRDELPPGPPYPGYHAVRIPLRRSRL